MSICDSLYLIFLFHACNHSNLNSSLERTTHFLIRKIHFYHSVSDKNYLILINHNKAAITGKNIRLIQDISLN